MRKIIFKSGESLHMSLKKYKKNPEKTGSLLIQKQILRELYRKFYSHKSTKPNNLITITPSQIRALSELT